MERIRDYFLIGDLHTAALVSSRGSIDWLCLPTFDSPSVFGAILDDRVGGRFSLHHRELECQTAYLPHTAIVETVCKSKTGSFSVRDFMRPQPTEEIVPHFLVRKVTGLHGTSHVTFLFDPSPRYARQQRVVVRQKKSMLQVRLGERSLWLHLPPNATVRRRARGGISITFTIHEGESHSLILEYSLESRLQRQDRDLEKETLDFWEDWVQQGTFDGPYRSELIRSAITLKLMQFYPTGGLIAAPTTSLPEDIGGVRNWDYRYVWIRDATFALYGFSVLGYRDEARKFFRFIETIVRDAREELNDDDLDLHLMYTIWGQVLQQEEELAHLSGYRDSRPVRIGNAAAQQFQLDLYGSLIDAYYFMHRRGLSITAEGREVILLLMRHIARKWKHKDSGIWEVRSGPEHFTYSKVMCWVGIDRALRMADELGIPTEERRQWEHLRQEIHDWIWRHCFDEERTAFRQHPDTAAQDATNFLFVLLQFLDRNDPRTRVILQRTMEELAHDELFTYRYHAPDGLPGGEGAFLLCSFWMIAALAACGDHRTAAGMFKRIHALLPHSGLMAEEINSDDGEYLGNFPQAFSHIGYIISVYYLERYGQKNT